MKKHMTLNFRKFFISYLVSFFLSSVIGLIIFFALYFSNDKTLYAAINGTSLSAVILLSLGGLMFVSYEGFFDIFSFGFKQLGSAMFSKKANENKDFAEYKEQSRTKRVNKPKIFVSFLAAGLIFLIAMIVVRIAA